MKPKITVHTTISPGPSINALRPRRMLVHILIMPHHNIILGGDSSSIALRAFVMSKALAVGSAEKVTILHVLQGSG